MSSPTYKGLHASIDNSGRDDGLPVHAIRTVVDCDHVYVEPHTVDRISEADTDGNWAQFRYHEAVPATFCLGVVDRLSHSSDRGEDCIPPPIEGIHSNWLYRMPTVS